MREDAFRSFLEPRLSRAAVGSYLSNIRAVERLLDVDIDLVDLTDDAIAVMRSRLAVASMPSARVSDCASAMRQYCHFRDGGVKKPHSPSQHSRQSIPRPTFITAASIPELMRLYADVMEELRDRKVTRTANGPVGDYAELLFARAFHGQWRRTLRGARLPQRERARRCSRRWCGASLRAGFDWTLATNSASHHDATDTAGTRYQIKGRRIGSGPGGRQLGALRRLDEDHFDILAAVLLDRDMQVLRAALIPYRIVMERAKRSEHTNSWRFMLADATWNDPTVRDATDALRKVATAL